MYDKLTKLSGIGQNVANCVALISLDRGNAIPTDVHVQHIASRDYAPTVLDGAENIKPRTMGIANAFAGYGIGENMHCGGSYSQQ